MSVVDAILEDEEELAKEFAKLKPVDQLVVNWQMNWLRW